MPADLLAEVQAVELRVSRPTVDMLTEGMAQGLFPQRPLALLAFGPQSAFWGAIQLVWSGYLGDIDRGDYLEEITTFVLAGLVHHDRPLTTPSGQASAKSSGNAPGKPAAKPTAAAAATPAAGRTAQA